MEFQEEFTNWLEEQSGWTYPGFVSGTNSQHAQYYQEYKSSYESGICPENTKMDVWWFLFFLYTLRYVVEEEMMLEQWRPIRNNLRHHLCTFEDNGDRLGIELAIQNVDDRVGSFVGTVLRYYGNKFLGPLEGLLSLDIVSDRGIWEGSVSERFLNQRRDIQPIVASFFKINHGAFYVNPDSEDIVDFNSPDDIYELTDLDPEDAQFSTGNDPENRQGSGNNVLAGIDPIAALGVLLLIGGTIYQNNKKGKKKAVLNGLNSKNINKKNHEKFIKRHRKRIERNA